MKELHNNTYTRLSIFGMMLELNKKYQILLLEDYESEHHVFRNALRNIDYPFHCVAAKGWVDVQKTLSFLSPDFIFLDIKSPNKNGLDYLKEIKKKKELSSIPMYLSFTGISDIDPTIVKLIDTKCCSRNTIAIKALDEVLSTTGLKLLDLDVFKFANFSIYDFLNKHVIELVILSDYFQDLLLMKYLS